MMSSNCLDFSSFSSDAEEACSVAKVFTVKHATIAIMNIYKFKVLPHLYWTESRE